MSNQNTLSPEEVTQRLARLKSRGVKIYDLRNQPLKEQERLFGEIQQNIADLLEANGLAKDFPITFVAGSGKTKDRAVLAEGRAVGKVKQAVITGGSKSAVMGQVALGAKVKIGITCDMILPREVPDRRYQMLIIADGKGFEGLDNRLKAMRRLASQELSIQGGMGTLEETLGGIKVREKLDVLVPFWSPLIATLKKMHCHGFITQQELDKVHPVDNACAPAGDALSFGCSLEPQAENFRIKSAWAADTAKRILTQRRCGNGHILDESVPLQSIMPGTKKKIIAASDYFIVPPNSVSTLHQAALITCEKRMVRWHPETAPNPGIDKKPLILLNVDGFYDGFIEQWQQMEKGGFLDGEKVSDLITEVKISNAMQEKDIRAALNAALPAEFLKAGKGRPGDFERKV